MVPSRHLCAMLCACLLLSRSRAFHVTPWTRIGHPVSHPFESRIQSSPSCIITCNRFQPLYASSTTKTLSRDMMTLEREVVRLGKRGKTDQALDLYFSASRPSIRLMNSAIDACARARPTRLDQAFEILVDGTTNLHLSPNVFTFGVLMSACARARRADRALEVLRSMQDDYGVRPNAVVYSTAISACARADPPQPKQALKLLDQAPLDMSVVGYNAALSACAMAGQWEEAIDLLQQMEVSELVKPDGVSYGTVLAACERSQQWKILMERAKEMQSRNIAMDGMAVTSVLHACQQLGLAREAMDYLQMMKTATPTQRKTAGWQRKGVRSPLKGADAVAYRLAISACARGGKWQDGIRLLDELRNETSLDVMSYTAAITGCEYAGEWQKALGLLDSMRKDGVDPNVVTFAAVVSACATAISHAQRHGKTEEVDTPKRKSMQLLRVMKKDPTVVDPNIVVYNAAIRVCAEALDLKGALELLDELEDDGLEPTVVTFGSLMTACERVGDVDGCSRVFQRMKEYSIEPNEIIYGAAISCCRKARQPDRVLLLLRKMIREGLAPNVATFNTVLVSQAEGRSNDSMDRAILVYKLMKSKYASPSARPNRQTYNLLIRALTAKHRPLDAEAFLRKMQADGFVPDVDLYTATVTAYERAGQPLKALRLMESMSEDGYDFYEVKVLDAAFKKAVEMANVVGRGLRRDSTTEEQLQIAYENDEDDEEVPFHLDMQDGEGEAFINGTST